MLWISRSESCIVLGFSNSYIIVSNLVAKEREWVWLIEKGTDLVPRERAASCYCYFRDVSWMLVECPGLGCRGILDFRTLKWVSRRIENNDVLVIRCLHRVLLFL
jgi:hypothetical protein